MEHTFEKKELKWINKKWKQFFPRIFLNHWKNWEVLLGLASCYWRFVKNHGVMSKPVPLTNVLMKNNFKWVEGSSTTFEKLQKAMSSASLLALPDFNVEFTIEINANDNGVGPILLQQRRSIAFLCKASTDKNLSFYLWERNASNYDGIPKMETIHTRQTI